MELNIRFATVTMKVLVSRRPFLPRLDACLVLCCCFILLGSRLCEARSVANESGATKVEEAQVGLKSFLTQAGHVNEELKSVDEVDVVNEKRLRRVTETLGKSDKEHEDAKVKDVTVSRESAHDRKIRVDETTKEHLMGKKALKNPFRRVKRGNHIANEKIDDAIIKSVEDKGKLESDDNVGQNKRVGVEGIRRLDVDVEEEDKKEIHDVSKGNLRSAVADDVEKSAIVEPSADEKVQSIETKNAEQDQSEDIKNVSKDPIISSTDALPNYATVVENPIGDNVKNIKVADSIHDQSEGILPNQENVVDQNENSELFRRSQTFLKLQFLKDQALELQAKIRNTTFVQNLKEQVSEVLPDIPKFTENQFLEMLNTIITKKNIQKSNDFNADAFKDTGLNENQIEVIKCAQQLLAQKERQSFFDNMSECIRGLNVINCMRIFIYPIIVENMPEAVTQVFPNFPIVINVADIFQGNRDKPKSARQVPVMGFLTNSIDPEATILNILMEGLSKNPPNENLPSFIDAKNETFSKLLTCNRMKLLQMTEKFLPENTRDSYSDEMLSCVRRFEYFSCVKYFSWPVIKQYYAALPEFPLSDSVLSSLIYPNYPLIPYPGYESGFGHLPEVIESGPKRRTPETVISDVFRKALSQYPRITTLPTPIELHLVIKSPAMNQDQIASIHLAEQLLPVKMRTEYVTRTVQCIQQFDYYNCMKYTTLPLVKQFNPFDFSGIQDFLSNLGLPEPPQFPNILELIQQFYAGFPQFQLPEFPSFPDFSNLFPFGQGTTTTTAKPTDESTTASTDTSSQDTKKNDTVLEGKIYNILKNVRDSMGPTPLSPATYTNRKVFLFPLMTEDQSKIFALAEGILPPIAREHLITNTYFCLNEKHEFTKCAELVMWPFIRGHVSGLPEFPARDDSIESQQKFGGNTRFMPAENRDNFFIMRGIEKFFFEGREDAMGYIIRSLQLSPPGSFNMQIILDMLRSIQFNAPEFSNMQLIQYPRAPEFSSLLTENQENIIHAVESIIPDENRVKFSNDMIACAQKNKFAMCSRNVIFPAIYPYFQRSIFSPIYNIMPDKSDLSKVNKLDMSRISPVGIETKINAEKKGENIIITSDKSIIPIYPSNPESVIFSMLRKVQINAESLPDFPKLSIAYTPEFKQAFNVRQAHILTVAEGILPEEYRKGLLENMYVCNQKDSFLNCARDVLYPAMAKTYPEFSSFPDFKNDLNRSNMLSVIDSFNKPSTSLRAYDSKRTLPSIDVLYKFVPEDKANGLRVLIDRLPDTLYYDLYIKMVQCSQYSDSISCGHNIIYPTLKKFYDAPGFNLDDYYPIATLPPPPTMVYQRPPYDYEILCENMGFSCTLIPFGTRYAGGYSNSNVSPNSLASSYMPFGRLSDGSRIFKHFEDIWNTNITPSVRADQTSISEYATQSSTNYLNSKSKFFSKKQQKISLQDILSAIKLLKRNKRNVDDLLDSYPDVVPIDKKNSVSRRIPPKLTFPNISETELLQIFRHISELKHERVSENIVSNGYFVDSLNDTEKSLITNNQYEILKLIQGLNSETAKASFMSRLVQCIRSLSFIRCVGIFVWPMIASNLPSLPFTLPASRGSRTVAETQIQQLFGVSASDLESELLSRREQIESNFIQLYKTLTEETFVADLGPLKIKGHGDGELAVTFSGFREGRLSRLKDNKNLPSILTIISEVIEEVFDTRPNKTKNRKDNLKKDKRSRSLHSFEELNFGKHLHDPNEENSKRSVKDDQVINMLLDRMRPSFTEIGNDDIKNYYNIEDANRAFQVLFGPKIAGRISNQLKTIETGNMKNFEGLQSVQQLKLAPLDAQITNQAQQLKNRSSKGRALYQPGSNKDEFNSEDKTDMTKEKILKLKAYLADHIKKYLNLNKKKFQSEVTLRLPRLNDTVTSRKMTNNFELISRDMKSKIRQALPAAGLAVSFLVQIALAHAKAAASVAEILSNMALGSAMFGMVRDMVFGSNNQQKIKYVYDTEKYDAGISWPSVGANSIISFKPPPIRPI
ncbi:uncharacterized protein LOC100679351 [Nasonia vitripennis]|uniref:Uncharacterized protein n=1 Tax=Nasonia vitripennis TaxID=7425 RepID=A0A7M7Q3P4_NASVI|nr:uncharacterized protein LOC100679351 [Nasonia vitripennis]